MISKDFVFKGILVISLMFGLGYCIYFMATVFFIATVFEPKDHYKEKVKAHDTVSEKGLNKVVLDKKPTDTLQLAEKQKAEQQAVTDNSSVGCKNLKTRHERLECLIQASMTDPDEIIIPPSAANDWRGVTRGELTARQEKLERLIQAGKTDPDEIIIPPSEANDWTGVTRGELTARQERLDGEIQVSMTDPDESIISPSESNEWQGVTRGELTARHKRLNIEIENSMKNPKNIVFP